MHVYLIVSTRCVVWVLYCVTTCVLSTNVHLLPLQLARCQRRDRRERVWCPISLSVESELHSLRLELSVTCRLQLSLLPCCALIYTLMFDLVEHAMGSQDAHQMQGPLCTCQLSNGYLECQHTSAHLQHQEQFVFSMELTKQTGRKHSRITTYIRNDPHLSQELVSGIHHAIHVFL